jgi:non-ribosomal peptide synthetase component F
VAPVPRGGHGKARHTCEEIVVIAVPALQSYASDVPLLGDTAWDDFARTVARHGDREALDCPSGRRWTYRELRVEVEAVAHGLLAAGIGKGDRVGIQGRVKITLCSTSVTESNHR